MGIDSSIYSNIQTPDILGNFQKGLAIGDMFHQRKKQAEAEAEQKSIKDIFKKNVSQDEKGNLSMNKQALLKDLFQVSPDKAMEQQQTFAQQDKDAQKFQMEKRVKDLDLVGRVAGSINDQNSYEQGLNFLAQNGVDVSKMPGVYNPSQVEQYKKSALSAMEQLSQGNKDREYGLDLNKQNLEKQKFYADNKYKQGNQDLEYAKLGLNKDMFMGKQELEKRGYDQKDQELLMKQKELAMKQLASGAKGGLTEGQKKVDQDYAKDYNDWTSTGRVSLQKNLQALKEARDALAADSDLSGGMTGVLPDRLTADKVLAQRQRVGGAVQGSLKATLGSQFTEKEGERILKNAYNEAASPETNLASLDRLINELETAGANNDAKAAHYEQAGSLKGFSGNQQTAQNTPPKPKSGDIVEGYVYMGGDPSSPDSWKPASSTAGRGK